MAGGQIDPRKVERFWQLRKRGFNITQSAKEAGMSYATARRIQDALNTDNPVDRTALRPERSHPAPTRLADLRPEPAAALDDFALFLERYFGFVATGWQVEAALYIRDLLASPEKEYAVLNAPPGVGKSTLMTLCIPAWLICRDRSIRGATFSNTQNAANKYVHRLKRFLERTSPMKGDPMDIDKGLALDALATVGDDYGAFKPAVRDNWSQEQFVVAQLDGMPIDEKEPTWSAFGFDSQYIGMRLDYIVADDVVDKRSIRTLDAVDKMRTEWNDVAERRLDPGGLLVLQGQRLGANDLYRYCADKPGYEPEDTPTDLEEARSVKMYHHMVWKGHYEDRCERAHAKAAPSYPIGCLLDSRRLTWPEMSAIRANDRGSFSVVIQQEDTDPVDVLVKPVWVHGGIDPDTGTMHPGCWDKTRNLCELPSGLAGTLISYATVDPSAARWWSCCAKGTKILTRRGEVPIERVVGGDYVMTRRGWRAVLRAACTGTKPLLQLELSNGRTLKVTPDHRLAIPGGWAEAAQFIAWSTDHVLRVRGEGEMVGIDAGRVFAEMVDLPVGGNGTPPEPERQPVGEVLAAALVHGPVTTAAPALFEPRTLPLPAAIDDDYPGCHVFPVEGGFASPGQDAVTARYTSPRRARHGAPTVDTVHVISITRALPAPVYDLEVADAHEFVAEGVVVHNCQWWVTRIDHETGQPQERYLMDLHRAKMMAPDLLEWTDSTRDFSGLMDEWQKRSVQLKLPITRWVIEKNGCQRFLMQYDFVRRWMAQAGVDIVPHETTANKLDPDKGVQSLQGIWKYGLVRLPGKGNSTQNSPAAGGSGWIASMKLVDEVTHYPDTLTTDCVMAQWFGEYWLPTMVPDLEALPVMRRPGWLKGSDTYGWLNKIVRPARQAV